MIYCHKIFAMTLEKLNASFTSSNDSYLHLFDFLTTIRNLFHWIISLLHNSFCLIIQHLAFMWRQLKLQKVLTCKALMSIINLITITKSRLYLYFYTYCFIAMCATINTKHYLMIYKIGCLPPLLTGMSSIPW